MKEGGPIKSARELIERAQIQLVLHDRLIWENGYSEGRFHSMEERKQQQCLEAEWIVSHGLDTVMSRGDTRLLNQEIETVEDPIRSQRSFECEAIEPILWACSFVEKLTPIGKFMLSDFHVLLVGQSKDELSRAGRLRKKRSPASVIFLCFGIGEAGLSEHLTRRKGCPWWTRSPQRLCGKKLRMRKGFGE